jgi:hypothetical protein
MPSNFHKYIFHLIYNMNPNNYKIHKDNNKLFLSFNEAENKQQHNQFIKSITATHIIVGASTNLQQNKLFFFGDEAITLSEYLQKYYSISDPDPDPRIPLSLSLSLFLLPIDKLMIHLIDAISRQILYLEQHNYTFYKLTLESILVIDGIRFFVADPMLVTPLNPSIPKSIEFCTPINKTGFISPELANMTTLPAIIPHNSVYYSLGLLILYCCSSQPEKEKDNLQPKPPKEFKELLAPLIGTKLYWFIKRCLMDNPEKRLLLLI